MDRSFVNQLIIVEGLTGSGKSIMAHFIARQLRLNGVSAEWMHEAEIPHPIFLESDEQLEADIERFMEVMLERWTAFVNRTRACGQIIVIEACFFNNFIETLFMQNVTTEHILAYGTQLEGIAAPLNPALVYLSQGDVARSLERNFLNRGEGFKDFVIRLVAGTAYAKQRELEGYDGMVVFWQDFVAVTDALFQQLEMAKIMIDTSGGEWDRYNRQVLAFLSIPPVSEGKIPAHYAARLAGVYKDEKSDREFAVRYEGGDLLINLFLTTWTRLVPKKGDTFITEGWHFEVAFREDGSGRVSLEIGGEDVDYLALVGTVAEKRSR